MVRERQQALDSLSALKTIHNKLPQQTQQQTMPLIQSIHNESLPKKSLFKYPISIAAGIGTGITLSKTLWSPVGDGMFGNYIDHVFFNIPVSMTTGLIVAGSTYTLCNKVIEHKKEQRLEDLFKKLKSSHDQAAIAPSIPEEIKSDAFFLALEQSFSNSSLDKSALTSLSSVYSSVSSILKENKQ